MPGLDRKYVLAQFRSDADFSWVKRLRAELVVDELKYKALIANRPRLKQKKELWRKVENGVGQAAIIIVDPEPTIKAIRANAANTGMTEHDGLTDAAVAHACATAVIKETPVAFLPLRLAQTVEWTDYQVVGSLEDFTPLSILRDLGGGLREAKIFAARAHAMFDLHNLDSSAATTRDVFTSPLAPVLLSEFLTTTRYFDKENENTVAILNAIAERVAEAISPRVETLNQKLERNLISEADSRTIDELQAADVAAGWARDIFDQTGDPTTLASRFERVWVNGNKVK
jgi:hypothetical protein